MKILLVEDNEILAKGLIYSLEQKKYQVIHTLNVENTLKILKTEKIDLAILDVMMPDVDGFTVAQRIRKNDATKNIPILMVTARSQEEDKLIGEETGADEYITKPFELDEVVKKVEEYLK